MIHSNICLKDIMAAHERISNYIRHTPLEYNEAISRHYNAKIYLKLENLQVTGSFKARGAYNRILTLTEREKKLGVIAPSAGNHGIGLAYAANDLNIPANIYLPENADSSKVQALRRYNATMKFFNSIEEARLSAIKDAADKGFTFVSAYNDPFMIEAGGTVALEILRDLKDVDIVITSLGGGGLTSGLGLALKSINPNINIWGVQTENSPTIATWYEKGKVIPVSLKPSIAEGLSGPIDPKTITFPIIQKNVDRILTVKEEEILEAMHIMLILQYIVEPSGAAGLAILDKVGYELQGKKVAIIITGRNISWSRLSILMDK